jgi:cbb3-type cytochrome oxidase subunit 1
MPPLSRWFVRTALVYFVAALITGVALVLRPVLNLPPEVAALQPVYFHLLMVGWVSQLIFGVVYWMFPKYTLEKPRGSERLGWATFWLLNAGLVLRVVGEPLVAFRPGSAAGWLVAASAILQMLAGWAFVANTWGRVKER